MGMFVLGILFGWLIEWLFYTLYWKPAHSAESLSASVSPGPAVEQKQMPAASSAAAQTPSPAPVADPAPIEPTPSKPAAGDGVKKVPTGAGSPEKDLQKISGIGPKVSVLLVEAGIINYQDLANANVERLRDILNAAGTRYAMIDPATWPKQAAYLEKGDSEGLARYLESLRQ